MRQAGPLTKPYRLPPARIAGKWGFDSEHLGRKVLEIIQDSARAGG